MDTITEAIYNKVSGKFELRSVLDGEELDALRNFPDVVEELRRNYPEQMADLDFGIPVMLHKMSASYLGKYVSFDAELVGTEAGKQGGRGNIKPSVTVSEGFKEAMRELGKRGE